MSTDSTLATRHPVRMGVIGCGVIGTRLLTAISQSAGAEAVAVADLRVEAANEAAKNFGIDSAYAYGDVRLLLADQRVESVILALPAAQRFEIASAALACGKHLLIEKPVAMNAAQVEQLIDARGDRVVGCCSARYRLLPSAKAATDLMATGALGRLRVVRSRGIRQAPHPPTTMPPAWRLSRALNGGGILANWGCYDLDYLLGLAGWALTPETVFAQAWPIADSLVSFVPPDSDAETHAIALVRCRGGIMLSLERAEYVAAETEAAWHVVGEHGVLRLQMTPGAGKSIDFDELTDSGMTRRTVWQGNEEAEQIHRGVIDDFADAVRIGRPPATSLENALTVQRITDAIYRSAQTGDLIRLDERQAR